MHIGLRPRFLAGLYLLLSCWSAMPPKNTRKAHERGEDVEAERDVLEKDIVTSPLSSDAGSYSSLSSRSTSIALSSAQLESILAATSKANLDSSARLMESNQKAMEDSSAKLMQSNQKAMIDLIASLSPGFSGLGPPRPVQVKPPKWSDEDTPYDYFSKYEKAMAHNGVDKAEWGQLLPVYLAGRAQVALAQVNVEDLADYEQVKSTLLDSLGDTLSSADRKWWSLSRLPGEEPGSFYLRVRAIGLRRLHGLTSVGEITEKVILSRFLSLLPADCYAAVSQRQPETGLAASRMVQDFEDTRAYARRRQHWKENTHRHRREPVDSSSGPNDSGYGSSSSGGSFENFVSTPSDSGSHGAAGGVGFSGNGSQKEVVSGRGQSSDGCRNQESMGMRPAGRQVTCHGCGEIGHICPNCPNRIRRVVEKGAGPGLTVDGFLAGRPVSALKVDTGSGRTLVHRDFVPGACYTGRNVRLGSWKDGPFSSHRTANIEIKVGDVEDLVEVVVVDSLDCPAVLGNDLGSELHLTVLKLVLEKLEADPVNCDNNVVPMQQEEVRVNFVEASVARVDEVKVEVEQVAVAKAQSEEDPVPLSEIFYFSIDFFEEDPVTSTVIEFSTGPKVELGQISIPEPGRHIVDLSELLGEQQTDGFLQKSPEVDKEKEPVVEILNAAVEFLDRKKEPVVDILNEPVELLDVSDSYLEPDPVLTAVSEVKPVLTRELFDIPLTKEGRMSSESYWQSSDLVDSDQRFMHYYAKATRRLAPDCSAVIDCMLFLFLRFLLFALFVLKFSMCMSKFLVQQFVGDFGPRSVLWFHRTGEDLPLTFSSSPLLPITGIGGYVFSSLCLRQPMGGEML